MAKYTSKAALERNAKFSSSWRENSPSKEWASLKLDAFEAEGQMIIDADAEIDASDAHTKALRIKRDGFIKKHMESCDFVAAAVEGDRDFGSDSALYGGFGYIRKSEKKRGGRKPKPPTP